MLVTAINRTNGLLRVGQNDLLPGEGRPVTLNEFLQALAVCGEGLVSPDAPALALLMADEPDADAATVEPEEFSLDVLDGDADDLYALTRPELAELARTHGIVPGRMTKRELVEAISEYAD